MILPRFRFGDLYISIELCCVIRNVNKFVLNDSIVIYLYIISIKTRITLYIKFLYFIMFVR